MSDLPPPVVDYWERAFAERLVPGSAPLKLAVSETLSARRPAMILERDGEAARAAVRPEVAARLAAAGTASTAPGPLRERLSAIGVALHDPDHLFYSPLSGMTARDAGPTARRLTRADRAVFDAFYHAASEQDREDAFVELDHWAVFGCFERDQLVSAASLCRWDDAPIADLGVLTLPAARGRGLARAAVEASFRHARAAGHEPQYRCQLDNAASVALARSCGLVQLGRWTVARDPAG